MNWSKGRKQKLKSGVEEDVLYNRKLYCYLINRPKNVKKAKKAMTEGINAQSEVVTLGAEFWKEVLAWGRERKRLTPKDMQILEVCASMPRRIPSDLQARHALNALGRMRDQGFGES